MCANYMRTHGLIGSAQYRRLMKENQLTKDSSDELSTSATDESVRSIAKPDLNFHVSPYYEPWQDPLTARVYYVDKRTGNSQVAQRKRRDRYSLLISAID